MKKYDEAIVIGAGIVGAVLARKMAELGIRVTVYERRNHIGGNLYDYVDEYGIRVHKYGPHIFHTNIERVWEFVNKYSDFINYNLVCGAVIDGICVPTSFDFNAVDAFFPEDAAIIKDHIKRVYGDRKSATVLEMLDSDDPYVKKFADFLYEKDYAPYTAKQWGISAEEVDKGVLNRVPILFSYDSKYFSDKYQAIPTNGYTEMVKNILDHKNISVKLNTDILSTKQIADNHLTFTGLSDDSLVIYTGPVDELFDCSFGSLPYRSLRFEWKHDEKDSIQDMPVVAYPQEPLYTRITEYKKLPEQKVDGTTYAVEYPLMYDNKKKIEPYYPVQTNESKELYAKYLALAGNIDNLILCGRLADFKYYNIDMAIESALSIFDSMIVKIIE